MIKAIFFDIDGTLLSHESKSVPQSTIDALHQLHNQGIYLFIATGRHITEIKDLPLDNLPIDAYITLNGQYCYNKDGVIYDLALDALDINQAIDYIDKNHVPCIFVEDQSMYINFINETVELVQDAISTPLPLLGDIHRGKIHSIYQVIPYGLSTNQEDELLSLMPHCKKTKWHNQAIDIIPSHGGKHNGMKHVLDYYHLSKEETMAFGDGNNDIDMFEFVEISIAMGNASDEVKSHADEVTDDINHNGIYNALKKHHLI